jgi:hypothetical protein
VEHMAATIRQIVSAFMVDGSRISGEERTDFWARDGRSAPLGGGWGIRSFRDGPEPRGELMADKYASFDDLRRGGARMLTTASASSRGESPVAIISSRRTVGGLNQKRR